MLARDKISEDEEKKSFISFGADLSFSVEEGGKCLHKTLTGYKTISPSSRTLWVNIS
jgi:hypothetical protein